MEHTDNTALRFLYLHLFLQMDIFPCLWVTFSCMFACLVTFGRMPDIMPLYIVWYWVLLYSFRQHWTLCWRY